jgi:hypothetical protein
MVFQMWSCDRYVQRDTYQLNQGIERKVALRSDLVLSWISFGGSIMGVSFFSGTQKYHSMESPSI